MSEVRISTERLIAHSLILIIVSTLLYYLLPAIWRYLSPFLLAIPFAAIVQPVSRFLEKKCRIRHNAAVIIPLVLLVLIVLLSVTWFLSFGINQISYLLTHSDDVIAQASATVRSALSPILARFAKRTSGETGNLWAIFDNVVNYLTTQVTVWAGNALNVTVNWATSIPYTLLYLNFLFFGIYFIARDYDHLLETYHRGVLGNPDTQSGKLTNSAVIGLMAALPGDLCTPLPGGRFHLLDRFRLPVRRSDFSGCRNSRVSPHRRQRDNLSPVGHHWSAHRQTGRCHPGPGSVLRPAAHPPRHRAPPAVAEHWRFSPALPDEHVCRPQIRRPDGHDRISHDRRGAHHALGGRLPENHSA